MDDANYYLVELVDSEVDKNKLHIKHVIMKLCECHYGAAYVTENPHLLDGNRIIGVISSERHLQLFKKGMTPEYSVSPFWITTLHYNPRYVDCEEYVDNSDVLKAYEDEVVEYGEYGKVHHEYEKGEHL